jgi:hypothetical protein
MNKLRKAANERATKAPKRLKAGAAKAVAPVLSSQITVSGKSDLLSEFLIFIKEEGVAYTKKTYPVAAFDWGFWILTIKGALGKNLVEAILKFCGIRKVDFYVKEGDKVIKIKTESVGDAERLIKVYKSFDIRPKKK